MKRLVVGVAFGLLVVSCGGGTSAEDELAQAIADQMWEESQADPELEDFPFEFERADADCLGHAFVDGIGYETLNDAGITADALQQEGSLEPFDDFELDAESGEVVFEAMEQCFDFAGAMAEAVATEMGIEEASAKCLFDGLLAEEAFRQMMVAGIVGDPESLEDPFADPDPAFIGIIFELMTTCLTDEELAELVGS